MCGIFGYSLSSLPHSPRDWNEHARNRLIHRGPDGSGAIHNDEFGFGLVHTRLSIQDLSSSGNQPMVSPDKSVILVFNGEIFNFRELRKELQVDGYNFSSDSDTEVLLALYLSIRDSISESSDFILISHMLRRLNGIFAFALWDFTTDSILIARDAFGVKPIYIYHNQFGVFFASEIKALKLTDPVIDVVSLDRYLSFLWCPGEGTPLQNVSSLGPGELMLISSGVIKSQFKWYKIPYLPPATPEHFKFSRQSCIRGTERLVRKAVHRQLVSDVPVGAFLSGGLDSSSIVSFAREVTPNIRCFTIDVDDIDNERSSNDLLYSKLVAKHLDVQLDVIRVDPLCMVRSIEAMVWQLDEPLADLASLNLYYISRLANDNGIKVLLSGAGGDDLFTGYRRHAALHYEKFWKWLPLSFRIGLQGTSNSFNLKIPLMRRLNKVFSGAHLESDLRLINYFRWIDRADLCSLYTSEFKLALGNSRAEDPMLQFLSDLPPYLQSLDKMLLLEQRFFLSDHNLLYTDKMSMAAGVEVRVPFLDRELVDFASNVPLKYKQRGRTGKWVLKKAMEPYLPKQVIYRPKCGFGVPLRRWLRVELRDWLFDILSPERLSSRGFFDPYAVQCLISDNASGRRDASYTLLSLACIEIWCQYFLDCEPAPFLSPPNI